MRDPKRIQPMLDYVRQVWEKYPDMRLSQLILNTEATYFTEDDELMTKLKDVYKID